MRLSTKETRLNVASAASATTGLATSMQILNRFLFRVTGRFLAGIYLFHVNNPNTRTMCEICSMSIIKIIDVIDVVMVSLLLTLNRFHFIDVVQVFLYC